MDPGDCTDTLSVKYKNEEFAVTNSALLFSPTSELTVELSTCFRNSPQIPTDINLRVDYAPSGNIIHANLTVNKALLLLRHDKNGAHLSNIPECPGCSVTPECLGKMDCDASCGHILSPSFPQPYDPGISCSWIITVADGHIAQLEFKHFDVYEMDSPDCLRDRLEVFSLDPWNKQNRMNLGTFCNTKVPKGTTESKWNMMSVVFTTDSALNGKGFWITYRGVQYEVEDNSGQSPITFGK